jgi:hypothetical protein
LYVLVQVWGSDDVNRLKKASKAANVDGVSGATSVSAGFGQTCAILRDQSVTCFAAWQDPAKVSSVSKVQLIAVRGSEVPDETACAITKASSTANGVVACWGFGSSAELDSFREFQLPGNAVDLVMGDAHTCALIVERAGATSVWCWGRNTYGQLGQGTVTADGNDPQPFNDPLRVTGLDGIRVRALARGYWSTFALTQNGGVYGWGFNGDGGLANGILSKAIAAPGAMKNICD